MMITIAIEGRFKASQGLATGQFSIEHGDKLTPTTQLTNAIIVLVSFHRIIKTVFRDKT